jgi:tetratricopeptide (TPR) repeat protein
VSSENPTVGEIPSARNTRGTEAAPDSDELPAGTHAGRYMLLSRLGAGGGGQVYAAYDPQLDRKVAIKLLRTAATGSLSASQGETRLLREGQAMARLKHPNVLPVYDVGTIDQGESSSVFVAMELVEGGTLRQWLAAPRPRKQILQVLTAAGRGLAAAHAAGLVHRDFKPDNVLVDGEGRVFVTDFGIVRSAGSVDPVGAGRVPRNDLLATPLTQMDAVVGTPAYMAPEQYTGDPVDARTDQFSFCVTLYEALTGERPFRGKSFEAVMDATLSGTFTQAGRHGEVPAWLRRVVLRGLEVDPAKRHPSMEALLAALADDPAIKRRRMLAILGGAATLAIAGVGVTRLSAHNRQLCRGAERKLEGVWDDPVRARLRASFARAGIASQMVESVSAALDRYARGFVDGHTEACEATRLRAEQPEPVLALRMSCLDGRLKELGALTSMLAGADRETAQKSLDAVSSLSSLRDCSDVAALTARVPPPSDPEARKQVERLRGRIAEARALADLSRRAEALKMNGEVLAAAGPLRYEPLRAEALELQGYLLDEDGHSHDAVATLAEAIDVAYAGHDDALVARAATTLAEVYGATLAQRTDGHRWTRLARAAISRLGGSEELEAVRLRVEASLFLFEGKGTEAVASAERALKLAEKVYGEESLKAAHAHGVLGSANRVAGNYARARAHHLANLHILEKLLGPDHPRLMVPLNNLGIVADSENKEEEAARYYRAAVELAERTLGPKHHKLGIALSNYSSALYGLKRYEEALAAARRAVEIYDSQFGPDYADAEEALLHIGQALIQLHRPGEAIAPLERGLRVSTRGESGESDIAEVRDKLADALWESGRDRARARALKEQALVTYRKLGALGHDNEILVEAWLKKHPAEP